MKHVLFSCALIFGCAAFTPVAVAANIVWVSDQANVGLGSSDNNASPNGVFGSGAGSYPDQAFVNLLTSAGHTVTRFNPADSPTVLSAGDVATLNSYDLVILGRSLASSAFDSAAKTLPWNTGITKPLMATNIFLARRVRLGWFTLPTASNGETGGNVYAAQLNFPAPADPISSFLLGSVANTGGLTANSIYEQVTGYVNPDRGQNFGLSTHSVLPGSTIISTVSNPTTAGNAAVTGVAGSYAIVSIPAGSTAVALGTTNQTLGGYRLFFAAGNQEPATAPENVTGNSGFENLTADGEQIFLRAVTLAVNNGVVPEPSTSTLIVLLGGLGLARRRR